MMARRNVPGLTAITLSILALALSGCGTPAPDSAGAAGETDTVQLGYFPLVHTSTAVHADKAGLFEDEGLPVELVATSGGAAAIPALVSGNVDITYANYTSALLAVAQGLPIKLVSGNDVGASDHGIYVAEGSEIEEPADLAGKTFAVNNLQNIGTVAISALLENAGVDPTAVKLVEMPLPDMQAAIERGAVDAIWQVEPFQASAEAAGLVKISDLFTGPVENMPVAGWITTEQFAKDNPEAVKAFQAAIKTSAEELEGDREKLVGLVPTFTKVPVDVVEKIQMPNFEGELDVEGLQYEADLMLKYKLTDKKLDIPALIAE